MLKCGRSWWSCEDVSGARQIAKTDVRTPAHINEMFERGPQRYMERRDNERNSN